jgi:predicted nucleotidyltransferase
MINRTECIQKLQACKNVMTEKYGVHSMRLFGSVARNEQNESSDVDVCVEMEPSLLRRSGLKIYLEEMLKCKVDVLRVHKNMDSYLSQQIARDGILIFK